MAFPPWQDRPAQLANDVDLTTEARALLQPAHSVPAYIELLGQQGHFIDAFKFLAQSLPKREAVWWGALCTWHVDREGASKYMDDAYQTVLTWVREPSEEQRRRAGDFSKELGRGTPAGCLAFAVFCSGGSLSAPDLPVVAPPAGLTARCVGTAVTLAYSKVPPPDKSFHGRQFIRAALEFAEGKLPWI